MRAFAEDTTPAAKAVEELLKDFSKEACEKFLADLPKLMPDDPVTATVLADATAEAMAEEVSHAEARRGGGAEEITQEQAEKIYEEMMAE